MALFLITLPLCAQLDNGNITGRVTDSTGAVVPGAKVTVTQTEMNFETVLETNADGDYRAASLRPGPYRITVVAPGFKRLVRPLVDLRMNQTLEINAAMDFLGQYSHSVLHLGGFTRL
jgi:hypothetical protein